MSSKKKGTESVNNWLFEILRYCIVSECAQVDSMKRLLVPEVRLLELFHIKGLICKWRHMQIPNGWKHESFWLEEFSRVNIRFQHALIVKHISHGLGNDHINVFWQFYFFNF